MTPAIKKALLFQPFDYRRLTGTAAHYSLDGAPSDMTYIVDGSGRMQLVADRSGNSGVNCLVLPGTVGSYASVPDSATLSITGDIACIAYVAMRDWTPAATTQLVSKRASGQDAFSFRVQSGSTGKLQLVWWKSGASNVVTSTAAPAVSDEAMQWVAATLDADNGAGGKTVTFYTSTDGSAWMQLGAPVVTAGTTSVDDTTAPLTVGGDPTNGEYLSGRVKRVQIRSGGLDGTVVLDADFTRVAKLAGSFVCSTGQTVTINTSGDTGARICGARDLVQLTQAKQPIVSVAADGMNIATFDGTDDYMKAAPFPLSQPESVYWVGSQETWAGRIIFDGLDAQNAAQLLQFGASPGMRIAAGGDWVAHNNDLPIGKRGLITAAFHGEASWLRVNRVAKATGSPGNFGGNGFTLGCSYDGAAASNITFCEAIVRSRVDSDALSLRIAAELMRKWRVQP